MPAATAKGGKRPCDTVKLLQGTPLGGSRVFGFSFATRDRVLGRWVGSSRVGERSRTRRHEMGLTLKQVAKRTGLSVSLISQIGLGKSAASVLTLYKLSAALGVKMAHFFEKV